MDGAFPVPGCPPDSLRATSVLGCPSDSLRVTSVLGCPPDSLRAEVVPLGGLEPTTPSLRMMCSTS
jgi:hypothetical protein